MALSETEIGLNLQTYEEFRMQVDRELEFPRKGDIFDREYIVGPIEVYRAPLRQVVQEVKPVSENVAA